MILYGSDKALKFKLVRENSWKKSTSSEHRSIPGVIETMKKVWDRWRIPLMQKYMHTSTCQACQGKRLSPEALSVTYRGYSIFDFNTWSIEKAHLFFSLNESALKF